MTSILEPIPSVVPERLRSITAPSNSPIISEELNTITEPIGFTKEVQFDIPIEISEK